jgi:membrane protein
MEQTRSLGLRRMPRTPEAVRPDLGVDNDLGPVIIWGIVILAQGKGMAHRFFSRVRDLYRSFLAKNVITLAASVSFFGFLSLFPFLVLVVSLASFFFERRQALQQIDRLLQTFPQGVSEIVTRVLAGAVNRGHVASVVSFLVLVYSSFAAFGELRSALNKVLGTQKKTTGWIATLEAFGFFMAVSVVVLLLMLSGGTLFVLARKLERLTLIRALWVVESAAFLGEILLCSVSYRYLASKRLRWKNVVIGGLFTAVLWEILKVFFSWYVSSLHGVAAVYGFIGSIFFLMLWLFYAVLIYFAGAHISVELP